MQWKRESSIFQFVLKFTFSMYVSFSDLLFELFALINFFQLNYVYLEYLSDLSCKSTQYILHKLFQSLVLFSIIFSKCRLRVQRLSNLLLRKFLNFMNAASKEGMFFKFFICCTAFSCRDENIYISLLTSLLSYLTLITVFQNVTKLCTDKFCLKFLYRIQYT